MADFIARMERLFDHTHLDYKSCSTFFAMSREQQEQVYAAFDAEVKMAAFPLSKYLKAVCYEG